MTGSPKYTADDTALVFLDPYNDFLAQDGKLWPRLADVAAGVSLHEHMRSVLAAARRAGIPVVIAPHHRHRPGDFDGWDHPTPYRLGAARIELFAVGT